MRRWLRVLVGVITVWSVVTLAWEARSAARPWLADPPEVRRWTWVWAWQFHTPKVENLERFLRSAEDHLPSGAQVAFQPVGLDTELRFLWAAYLMPRYDVIWASDLSRPETVDYVLVQRARLPDPRLELLAKLPGGTLYRVRQ